MKENQVGQYIKTTREKRGLSVRRLAMMAEVDASWLSKVERGLYQSPDPRYLYRLARALDIETADLYLQAGYEDGRGLPGFAPYLRARYDLPEPAINQLEAYFEFINEKFQQSEGGAS
jgi:transcriptional regulator with XRE-family HTH domain